MATTKKKVVTKDDLRRFMKEKQSVKAVVKKIEHPLAKYNSLNQLICVLCNNIVKNDLLWPAHIQSKQHKERVLELKTQGPAKPEIPLNVKRKVDDDLTSKSSTKRLKTGSTESQNQVNEDETRDRVKAALLAGYSSSSSSDESYMDDEEEKDIRLDSTPTKSNVTRQSTSQNELPEDFFDQETDAVAEQTVNKKMSEILPEGFFDDPKLDAKVRNVEYKDKDEEQWDLFQKAIKEEAQVSEVIMEEEDEQVNIDRNIDEIDDQIHRWQEVENLHVKKETILKSTKADTSKDNTLDDEIDDEELDSLLNWRAKQSLK